MKNIFRWSMFAAVLTLFQALTVFAQISGARVGFYTGTFDPPHAGHHALIERAVQELNLDLIYITAGANQTHKPNATPFAVRDKMAREAFKDIPQARFLNEMQRDLLIKVGIAGVQQELANEFSNGTLFQILGDDSLDRLKEKATSFPKNFVIAISGRAGNVEIPKEILGIPVIQISGDDSGLSSTQMRAAIKDGKDPSTLSSSVLQIIHCLGLYGAAKICPGPYY